MERYFYTSMTRPAGLAERAFTVEAVPRERWRYADYVVAEITAGGIGRYQIEVPDGRLVEVLAGDTIVGALGSRHATLEIVGDWREIGDDLQMEALSIAGGFGKCTSRSLSSGPLIPLAYRGHVLIDGAAANMSDFALAADDRPFGLPVVLIIGTSMDSGKTSSAKTLIRYLKGIGLRVAGAKLTGMGRYRDILAMRDAGADCIYDFVDVGLPSTLGPPEEYRERLQQLLGVIAAEDVDVLVAEAGASPLEPYNGAVAVAELSPHIRFTVLCASDPYAVVGVIDAFKTRPDLVAGRATSTSAGIGLIETLTGAPALNLLDPACAPRLDELLRPALGAVAAR